MSEEWFNRAEKNQPIVKVPLQFHFEPVEILSKQLTKLNSSSPYRILYLGPRADDSAALHKRYANKGGYTFNDKQINKNNNFFSETMCQNQFYRNQVYYRAFQGVNPTINRQQQLQFNSRFQSGNLDCVVKVGSNEYDLFLRIDSNTQGHLFWFYFEISNGKPGTVIKINICNMTKSIQLYQRGFKPYSSVRNPQGLFQNWSQQSCYDVCIGQKKLRYQFIYEKVKVRRLLQLSFKYKFESKQPVRFAYCVPYTYSQMLAQINYLTSQNSEQLRIGSIGRSLTGVDIPFLMVGKDSQQKNQQKFVIVCIGRLHPGQTNGSHVLSGMMNYVCASSQAEYIRKKCITIFIPMINPDGVILGNSRTGAVGRDLNRQFKAKNKNLFPEIYLLKQFCNKILQTHDIEMFLDFHGHSRKKNMFFFGPNYNITQPQYYRSRVMPRILSQITPIFRYFGCDYSIPPNKSTTARAVMLQQLNIPYVYAIQTSVGQYFDYQSHKILPFNLKKWIQLGGQTGRSLKQYCESIEQFSQYVKYKSNNDTQINKNGLAQVRNSKIPPLSLKQPSSPQKGRKSIVKDKEIKIIKIFQEIKIAEQQRRNIKKKNQQSDNSSDSQNEQDNLEGKKRAEFEGMVSQCIQTEKKRKQREQSYEQNKNYKLKRQQKPKISRKKILQREQVNFMKQIMKNSYINSNMFAAGDEKLQANKMGKIRDRKTNRSQQCSNKYKNIKNSYIFLQQKESQVKYQQMIAQHKYFDDNFPERMAEKSKKNLNLRMFNFSKMIENIETRNAATSGRRGRSNRYIASLRQINTLDSDLQVKNSSQLAKMNNTINKVSVDQSVNRQLEESDQSPQRQTAKNVSSKKMKGLYPASFYRIKYQNYQKKKQQRYEEQCREQKMISEEQYNQIQNYRKRQGHFLNIKRVNQL